MGKLPTMFIGEFTHNLDDKGRLAIPVKFRRDLTKGAVVTRGLDNCLFLYTKNEWEKAIDKMPELSSATILHDTSKNVSKEYGVLSLPSSMHKGQFPGHTYLVIDKEGIIRFIKDDPQMAVRNDELTTELEKLN